MNCRSKRVVSLTGFAALLIAALLFVGAPRAFAAELETAGVADNLAGLAPGGIDKMVHVFADVESGSVTWDASTKTVTMDNATIDLDKQSSRLVQYGILVDGINVYPKPTVTLNLVGTNTIKGGDSAVNSAIRINNANLNITGKGSLTAQTPSALFSIKVEGKLTAASGTVRVLGGGDGIQCDAGMALTGAEIVVKNTRYNAMRVEGDVSLKKGALTIDGADWNGIYAKGSIVFAGAHTSIKNVSKNLQTAVYASTGSVTVKAGTLKIANCYSGIACDKAFTMTGAKTKVTMSSLVRYATNVHGFTCKGGSYVVKGCSHGIYSEGNVKVAGGAVKISKADDMGIYAYLGETVISKGSVSVLCSDANKYAIYSDRGVSNKVACLKKVKGALGEGTTFKSGGNTYVAGKYSNEATLKSYGSSQKKPLVDNVTFGGRTYAIVGIAANAFNTKKGRQVTAVGLSMRVESIGAKAFYGTSKLTYLRVDRSASNSWDLNKKAFTKCGKGAGKNLRVKCKYSWQAKSLRSLFVKAGMSKKATFV